MKQLTIKTCILLICFIQSATAANILAVLPVASTSHHIWTSPLVRALAMKGHNVTVISADAQKTPVPHLTDIVVTDIYDILRQEFDFETLSDTFPIFGLDMVYEYMYQVCVITLKNDAWKQLMSYPPETKFDLVITESCGSECLLPGIRRFGDPPIVSLNAFTVPDWVFQTSGTPNMLSHIPNFAYSATDRMTFWQRVTNTFFYAYSNYIYHFKYMPAMDKAAREYYGPEVPLYSEIKQRIAVSMANFHPVLDYPYAITPNLIPVAAMQIKDPQPLPRVNINSSVYCVCANCLKFDDWWTIPGASTAEVIIPDLQLFLDEAKEGVILFSLGSNLRSEKLTPEKRKVLMETFAELPQKVLWKFEADSLPGQPKNVKISKWLPQSDILAHPNVKVFISHSGLLSTHEAIYRGVPVIGIPFFGDQPANIKKLVSRGVAIRLNFKELTKESLLNAIRTILNDPSYRENMKKLSARFRDDQQTPLERAVFWTEYVLRHKGAPHLQSAAKDLNFIQYFLLDVLAFIFVIPALLITILYWACSQRKFNQNRKQKLP